PEVYGRREVELGPVFKPWGFVTNSRTSRFCRSANACIVAGRESPRRKQTVVGGRAGGDAGAVRGPACAGGRSARDQGARGVRGAALSGRAGSVREAVRGDAAPDLPAQHRALLP